MQSNDDSPKTTRLSFLQGSGLTILLKSTKLGEKHFYFLTFSLDKKSELDLKLNLVFLRRKLLDV